MTMIEDPSLPCESGGEDSPYAPLKLDPDLFMDDLGTFEISKNQKLELLQTLWNIMSAMVDIGFGVDAVQYLLPDVFENASRDSVKLIELKDTQNSNT